MDKIKVENSFKNVDSQENSKALKEIITEKCEKLLNSFISNPLTTTEEKQE